MSLQQLKSLTLKYNERIQPLFAIGRKGLLQQNNVIDYINKYGLSSEDVEQLLRLANDMDIYTFDYSGIAEDEGLEFFGVIHSWYALSALKAAEAKDLFIQMIENTSADLIDDWLMSAFRHLIKPYRKEIYPYLLEVIKTEKYHHWVRAEYIEVIKDMAQGGEINLSEADALMEEILKNSKDRIINSVAIGVCIDLKLLHHHDLIVQCFTNGTVDIGHIGDLEDVEIEMGLKTKREYPKQPTELQKIYASVFGKNGSVTHVREEPKIGRNDPCSCGSGKKYKKCCQKSE